MDQNLGFFDLAVGDRSDTQLDVETYMGSLPNEQAYRNLFNGLDEVVRSVMGDGPIGQTVEVGAGNAAWTWGLARAERYENVYATDVSPEFLRRVAADLQIPGTTVIRSPAERLSCAEGGIDLVVGRSVLHHIYDYEAFLVEIRRWLAPGGAAVFFEPVLQGKLWVAFFLEMMRRIDNPAPDSKARQILARILRRKEPAQVLSHDAHRRLHGTMRHILKDYYHNDIDDIRAGLEDKYVFDINDLNAKALAAGFGSAEIVEQPQDNGLALQRIRGAVGGALKDEADAMAAFEPLFEAFAATFGLDARTAPIAPMAYFVFRP